MFELKKISLDAVPEALSKAERYRLLNEPALAESICLDILEADPENQAARIMLILALSDQSEDLAAVGRAREQVQKLSGEYERAYYAGLVAERAGIALLRHGEGRGSSAFRSFAEAMECYENAEKVHPPGNDDAILRWNTCARILNRNPSLHPHPDEALQTILDD
jgi:tetratricopeptide (TPR) repeat protein